MKTSNPARRSEQSRQAILSAAFDLVAESGYARLTIEAIAARAGVGKQTIYRWWPSKGAVLVDAFLSRTSDEEGASRCPTPATSGPTCASCSGPSSTSTTIPGSTR